MSIFSHALNTLTKNRKNQKLIDARLKMLVASDVLYIITQYLAKISVVAILLQLTPQRKHNLATWVVGGVCTVWLVASVLLITVDCEFNKPWEPAAEHCTGLVCHPNIFQFSASNNRSLTQACSMAVYHFLGHHHRSRVACTRYCHSVRC